MMDKTIHKQFYALMEIKPCFLKYIPDYQKKNVKNNHIISETNKIFQSKKINPAKKPVKFNPKNTKDYKVNVFKYWLKLLTCEENCHDHGMYELLDGPDDDDVHFQKRLVRVYLKKISGIENRNLRARIKNKDLKYINNYFYFLFTEDRDKLEQQLDNIRIHKTNQKNTSEDDDYQILQEAFIKVSCSLFIIYYQ